MLIMLKLVSEIVPTVMSGMKLCYTAGLPTKHLEIN